MTAAACWNEGYSTALRDFGIQVTEADIEGRITKNPHAPTEPRDRLTDHEKAEIRHALGYHFDDCATAEHDDQALILEMVVERILSRRPEREC